MTQTTRADCLAMDGDDPLARFRQEFILPEDVVYLDGNSLGAAPRAALDQIAAVVGDEWGRGLIRSWNESDWINLPQRVGDKIAGLIGAGPGEVIATDQTTVNIFKLVSAALRLRPGRKIILSERGNFPSDLYVMEGVIDMLGAGHELRLVEAADLPAAIDDSVALVELTHVNFKNGEIHDMKGLTRASHDQGALVLWDLCHSAGALPVDLNGCDADLAVGCGYKYLNGGPGAPAFVFVAQRLQAEIRQPLTGWLGHAAPFAFETGYRPAPGIRRMACGTPSVVALSLLDCALDIFAATDMAAVREKSVRLGDLFIALMAQRCGDFGFTLACPEDGNRRGSQVTYGHAEGYPIMKTLIARGVIGDFRAPDILRFGFTPLYTRYVDVWQAVEAIHRVMTDGAWDTPEMKKREAVT